MSAEAIRRNRAVAIRALGARVSSIAIVACAFAFIVVCCLIFGAWVYSRGDSDALRAAGYFVSKIPRPTLNVRLPRRRSNGPK